MWSVVAILLFALMGCGKCEHEYDDGVITKESTCTEEGEKTFTCTLCGETIVESISVIAHSYTENITKESTYEEEGEKTFTCEYCGNSYVESIAVLDKVAHNRDIYEQMVKLYDDGKYMDALMARKSAIKSDIIFGKDEEWKRIVEFTEEMVSSQSEYFNEQLQYAFENKDYEIIDALYIYCNYLDYFDLEHQFEYLIVQELQGVYTPYENSDDSIQVEINGYNIKIGEETYTFDHVASAKEGVRLVFEEGYFEEIRTGLIAITGRDGVCIKYESDAGREWERESQEREKARKEREERKQQEYLANEPKIGMTADEVKASNWGSPEKINKTTYEWGVTEQWCYPNYKYIYFEDGIVTAIQE